MLLPRHTGYSLLYRTRPIFVVTSTATQSSWPSRSYATQHTLGRTSSERRKQVTIANDDGRIHWSDLSAREKAARTTQQSVNLLVILVGMVATGGVAYFLYREVFSQDSKTVQFNRAVDRIKRDEQVVDILGNAKMIRAFGEPTWNKWVRNRPIASTVEKDRMGIEHLHMHFNVEGPLNSGTARVHMTRKPGEKHFQYRLLAVDAKGHQRIYLVNEDAKAMNPKSTGKMFGVRWW